MEGMDAAGGVVNVAVQDNAKRVLETEKVKKYFPAWGWVGVGLIAVMWPLNWLLPGLRTAYLFFPLWLGYSLTVDGLVYWRKGTSLLARSGKGYVALFLVSVPIWWLFELINYRTQNWFYTARDQFSDLTYFLLSSLCFSTVVPAVFGAAEFFSTFGFIQRMKPWLVVRDNKVTTISFFIAGLIMLALMVAWPLYFFPFVWMSVYFLTDPLNVWLGNRNLGRYTRTGDWRPVVSLFCGVMMTAFFWEMWNFFSYPKWIYDVPFVGFVKIFEMPFLGYFGYLPFALELFALYHLMVGLVGKKKSAYIEIG